MLDFRLCPHNHFDAESKKRIEAIWDRMKSQGKFKQEYPDICNGNYKGKNF